MNFFLKHECERLVRAEQEKILNQKVKLRTEVLKYFLQMYRYKKLHYKLDAIILTSQVEIDLLEKVILQLNSIYLRTQDPGNETKRKIERIYSGVEVLHPVECVDLSLVIFKLKDLSEKLKNIDEFLSGLFCDISIQENLDQKVQNLNDVGYVLESNMIMIDCVCLLLSRLITK